MCFVLFRSTQAFRGPYHFDASGGELPVHLLALIALRPNVEANIEASLYY